MEDRASTSLRKDLGLFDVYAISTGAMFSSGFFLLPGLAAAATGPSVPLAYLAAGFIIVPAMLCVAELATAMPRAGGAYYFLDRSMGPLVGTVGGLGTWLALILKTAFALVGMGAYLAIFVDVPVEPLAILLTGVFMAINIIGAKETSGLQRFLVTVLLVVMGGFIVLGWVAIFMGGSTAPLGARLTPFMPMGIQGFIGTIGLVFVSYAGLTKVASVAEEVRNPDRNIPLGMTLSLVTATFVYTVGVSILVALLPADELRHDLTPIASAAEAMSVGVPSGVMVALVVVAAVAAFASTGNAGILAASRYPLAMGRDGLVSARFKKLGRFRTPAFSILVTSALVAACIALFDVASIAKLASAFQLLLFSMLSLAVVIMRESGIGAYDPGYRAPFYPALQIFGVLAPMWLIAEMGQLAILFTLGLVTLTVAWYFYYARARINRSGAILHAFARLGDLRHRGLDLELRGIVKEKGLRAEDPFEEVVAQALVLDLADPVTFPGLVVGAAAKFEEHAGISAAALEEGFMFGLEDGLLPVSDGAALPHCRIKGLASPLMLLARCQQGLKPDPESPAGTVQSQFPTVRAAFFLVTALEEPTQHLRLLGHLASHVDDPTFLPRWNTADGDGGLKSALLREDRLMTLKVGSTEGTHKWSGLHLRQLELPAGCLIALIRRESRSLVPTGVTKIHDGDHLTIIGDPRAIKILGTVEGRRAVPGIPLHRALPQGVRG